MIRRKVSVILRICDAYTGKPLDREALTFTVDGCSRAPIVRPDGYRIFTDLGPGKHRIRIHSPHRCDEELLLDSSPVVRSAFLKPAAGYPYQKNTVFLELGGFSPDAEAVLAPKAPAFELKISQSGTSAGDSACKLFYKETAERVMLPRLWLAAEENAAEAVEIAVLNGSEKTQFSSPLRFSHKRGVCLYPALIYRADETGTVKAAFPDGADGIYTCLAQTGELLLYPVHGGDNRFVWKGKEEKDGK